MLRKFTIIGILWIGIISPLLAQRVTPKDPVYDEMKAKWEQEMRSRHDQELSKLRQQIEARIQADLASQKTNAVKTFGNKKSKVLSNARTSSAASTASAPLPTQAEYNALMDLYNSTGGPNWTHNDGWRDANPAVVQSVAGWFGITVDGNGHVISIIMYSSVGSNFPHGNNLVGALPSSIGNLSFLKTLYLAEGHLSGPIPNSIGNLSQLLELNLQQNELTGSIPASIGQLANLEGLYLSQNFITGSIPSTIGQTNLVGLDLWQNEITGVIPNSIGNLTNLQNLILGKNKLTGTIPLEISNLPNLYELALTDNLLSGPIPSELGSNPILAYLELSGNRLTGSIPSQLANLSGLLVLNLSDNLLTGSVPLGIGNLSELGYIKLSNNDLSGELPVGVLPAYIKLATDNGGLFCSGNDFTFTNILPAKIGYGTRSNGGSIFFYNPQDSIDVKKLLPATVGSPLTLTTSIDRTTSPASLYQWFKIVNGVSTPLAPLPTTGGHTYTIPSIAPADIGTKYFYKITNPAAADLTLTSKIQKIVLDAGCGTTLAQEYQALMDFYQSTNGAEWLNNTGWRDANPNVVQSVEGWYGIRTNANGRVTDIDFDGTADFTYAQSSDGYQIYTGNNLTGSLPTSIGLLACLNSFNVGGNKLTGSIPNEITQLTNLTWLIGAFNQFTGSIPANIGNLNKLDRIFLESNQLSGPIPASIGNLTNLWAIQLMDNQLSGSIPPQFGNLKKLVYVHLYNNRLTGNIPPELGGMILCRNLGLQNNLLTGSIPSELSSLVNLRKLYLGQNKLTGSIPSSLAAISGLRHLYLDKCDLSGSIPASIGAIPGIQFISVSNNNFTFSDLLGLKQQLVTSSFVFTNLNANQLEFPIYQPADPLGVVNPLPTTPSFQYAPQDSVDAKKYVAATVGGILTLTASVDRATSPSSLFQWFKVTSSGSIPLMPVPSIDGHTFTIPTISAADTGRYYYQIINSAASDLVLMSRIQQVKLKSCFVVTLPRVLVTKYLCAVGFTIFENRLNACAGTSFEWDFGDGTTSLDKNPIHPYSNLGTYNVSLKYTYQCGACTGDTTIYKTVTITPNSSTPLVDSLIQVTTLTKQKILNATASTFSDSWSLPFESNELRSKNSFVNGTQGVWRNNASYAFQAPRSQSSPINIAQDGTYTLNQFDWNSADLEIIPGWIRANSMTQYSSYSYELENRDVLGVYSAALYDYGGHLPSANGVNMRNNEMAFTSFEFLNDKPTGNWIFNNNAQPSNTTYNINTAKDYTIIVEATLEELSEVQKVDITAQREVYSILGYFFFPFANSSVNLTDVNIACRQVHPFNPKWSILVLSRLPFEGIWIGKATVKRLTVPSITPSIDNTVFHSGHSSLMINSDQSYVQPFMQLDSGKSYTINSWVSVNNPNVATPELAANLGFDILFKTSLGQVISSVSFTPSGNIIEGWQQVKGTFISPIKNPLLEIKFKPGSAGVAWYDDLRLHPEKGNMKAYVYDLKDYRLRSILDEENFASFFYYDVEGNLYLTKKETEKGIKTITENVSYQVEKP